MIHFIWLSLFVGIIQSSVLVDPVTRNFIDETGRVRIYHGVNAVYKIPPYHPDLNKFDPQLSITEEDITNLYNWGFNFIRLGVMWPGVAPLRSAFNMTYLSVLGQLVNNFKAKNITVLLDCHQDLLSPKFCGEGAPDWAVPTPNSILPFPYPALLEPLPTDPQTGYPLIDFCLNYTFARFYLADSTGCAFQNLYNNSNGIQTAFGDFWEIVATFFKNFDNVIGYELINEPWPGDIYSDPELLINPGKADSLYLQPMYDYLSQRIRAVDAKHLIFYEPSLADSVLPIGGFTHVPGGIQYNSTSVFSYHVYCGFTRRNGEPINGGLCDAQQLLLFEEFLNDYQKIGGGGFMTEWGNMPNNQTDVEVINFITDTADTYLQSWAWWQFKSFHDITTSGLGISESFYDENGQLQKDKVRALSRTYAYAIAGIPESMNFDGTSSFFQLIYTAGQPTYPTEIYMNIEWRYASGFSVTLSDPTKMSWKNITLNRIAVYHDSTSVGQKLTITINSLTNSST